MDQMLAATVIGVLMAYVPVAIFIWKRKEMGALNAAAALVIWGVMIPGFEHASFTISGAAELGFDPFVSSHTRYHFTMAGIYTIVGAVMISIIALTLLREGRRAGWYAILFVLLVGGGVELSGAGGILFHGFPPSWSLGLAIYAYIVAWAAALIIAYRPVFGGRSITQEVTHERS